MRRFTLPRDTFYGRGSLEYLKELDSKKAMIVVGGGSMRRSGILDRAIAYLKEAGAQVELIENVEPDPSVETVLKGATLMQKFNPDWIIAIGGGSPIDAAKAMWVFYEYPDTKFMDLIQPFSFPTLRKKANFCAVASTSGTATEVTAFSVITDYSTGIKYPLADYNITPDVAILDPDIADTMPASLTASTGVDALTHAIEAYVSTANSPFTDPLALQATQMVLDNLLDSYYLADPKARELMHYGQCLAGQAFSNALLGITHSMAHKTGEAFAKPIPHGVANAIYLPYVITFNAKVPTAEKRYATIARYNGLGYADDTDSELVLALIKTIQDQNTKLSIVHNLKDFGIDEKEFKEKIATISKNAIADACTGSNPRPINAEQMEKLYVAAYYGTEVDF